MHEIWVALLILSIVGAGLSWWLSLLDESLPGNQGGPARHPLSARAGRAWVPRSWRVGKHAGR